MEKLFSTDDVHPRDRFDYWRDVACRSIVSHDSRADSRTEFRAAIQTGTLADVAIVLFENSAMDVARTSRQIAGATDDRLFICRQMSGTLALEQNGREVLLEPGEVTILDPLLPYVGRFSPKSNLLVLKVPRLMLEARVGRTRDLVACAINPAEAEGGVTSSYLAMLPSVAGQMSAAADQLVMSQALDLVAVSVGKAAGARKPRMSCARTLALMRLYAAIEARLMDPALDARTVAAAAGISVRYANAVLARDGASLSKLIQTRRLERCRQALEDPMQAHRTLSEIAYGWGFSDMTHFSRRFKAAYGILPSLYRRIEGRREAERKPRPLASHGNGSPT